MIAGYQGFHLRSFCLKTFVDILFKPTNLTIKNLGRNYGTIVKGYFAWTFADDFEWPNGYTIRFGLYYTDYLRNLHRYPKRSVHWFTNFLKGYKWNREPVSSSPLRFYGSAPSDHQYLDE
jgi:beta-glucosidase